MAFNTRHYVFELKIVEQKTKRKMVYKKTKNRKKKQKPVDEKNGESAVMRAKGVC